MHTQAVVNQKGGCGKTTTAIHLATFLAREGRRTLLVDLDPQGHATLGLGLTTAASSPGTYEVLIGTRGLQEVLVGGPIPNLAIATASISLAAVEQLLAGREYREARLRGALAALDGVAPFDEVVLDCPPSLGLLTFNGLWAADRVLVPIDPSVFSLDGLQRLCETITLVEATAGRVIPRDAVLTMFDRRTRFGRDLAATVADSHPQEAALLRSRIRVCTRLREAALLGVPVTELDTHCNGFRDYRALTEELLDRRAQDGRQFAGVCDAVQGTVAAEDGMTLANFEVAEHGLFRPAETLGVRGLDGAPIAPLQPLGGEAGVYGPIPIAGGVIVRFHDPHASEVQIAGSFNDWHPDENVITRREEDGTWQKIVFAQPGSYEYRLVVDGDWEADPNNEAQVANSLGGVNSVLHV
jgi:chromosome partitioning protein